ncbi:MAG: phosphatase PAP2 family protein [Candidatus Sungbacteria bacterium]|nr:phosphatase PAP2 family protein [Candidatus Sungbacteria bacterium]
MAAFLYYAKFGGAKFILGFLVALACYFFWKSALLLYERWSGEKKNSPADILFPLRSLFLICFMVLVPIVAMGLVIEQLTVGGFSPQNVSDVSDALFRMDQAVFRSAIPFWFQESGSFQKPMFDFAAPLIITAYFYLSFIIAVFFLVSLVWDGKIFSRFLASFFICMLLSAPFWYSWPALSPHDAYFDNALKMPRPAAVEEALVSYEPNSELRSFFAKIRILPENAERLFLPITTFPSMHIAWATVILYFGILLSRRIAFFLVPYYALNLVGSFYTLQHYVVDGVAGAIVGFIAIAIASYFIGESPPYIERIRALILGDIRRFIFLISK